VTDVAAWLRGLGLGQYEAAFRDDGVDASVLPDLTAEDPKEMGVAAVGHRRKLLAAITALRGPAPSSYIPTDEQLPPARRRCRPVNTRLRHFCLPQHQDSALYPVISQLEGPLGASAAAAGAAGQWPARTSAPSTRGTARARMSSAAAWTRRREEANALGLAGAVPTRGQETWPVRAGHWAGA
jgi:hypothetical protein